MSVSCKTKSCICVRVREVLFMLEMKSSAAASFTRITNFLLSNIVALTWLFSTSDTICRKLTIRLYFLYECFFLNWWKINDYDRQVCLLMHLSFVTVAKFFCALLIFRISAERCESKDLIKTACILCFEFNLISLLLIVLVRYLF